MSHPFDGLVDDTGAPPDAVWKGVGIGAGMLGAFAVRAAIKRVRRGAGPARHRVVEGVLWTALLGAGAQLGRAVAHRIVVSRWQRRSSLAR